MVSMCVYALMVYSVRWSYVYWWARTHESLVVIRRSILLERSW